MRRQVGEIELLLYDQTMKLGSRGLQRMENDDLKKEEEKCEIFYFFICTSANFYSNSFLQ